MTIVYVSDADPHGSGYANIGAALCTGLAQRGHEVIYLGAAYHGEEHQYPYTLIPCTPSQAQPMIRNLAQAKTIEAIVVAFDIPLHEQFIAAKWKTHAPYIGIFPVEADPLCMTWASMIATMDARLIISRFGVEQAQAAGVQATYLPVGVDTRVWRPPTADERKMLRQAMNTEHEFVALTVADNQERKLLSRGMEIMAAFSRTHAIRYQMVTRMTSPVGWRLEDLAMRLGIYDRMAFWERGLPQSHMWMLYAGADVFLLTSKAEGLGMPALEAMACGCPVAATNCTSLVEHMADGRGLAIQPEYCTCEPFGNGNRYYPGIEPGVAQLERLAKMTDEEKATLRDKALEYVRGRKWGEAVDVLEATIRRVKRG